MTAHDWVQLLGERQRVRVVGGVYAGEQGYIVEPHIHADERSYVTYLVQLDSGVRDTIPHDDLEGLMEKQP